MEIKLKESQIDDLVKLVLSEERKKRTILPETWERAPAGKPKDPIGYWKALYDNLKKGGIPVQYQYANDPAKSTFMWWGSWVIYKDLNKNGGYPISFTTPKKNQYLFKFKDGIYKGTSDLSKLMLTTECINYLYPMSNPIFKKNQKDITTILYNDLKAKPKVSISCATKMVNFALDSASVLGEKDRKALTDAFNSSLGPFLEKNKPASTTYFKGRTQQTLTYNTGQGLQFRSDGTIHYPKDGFKNGAITKYGTWTWDAKSGKPTVKNLNGQTLDIGQVIYNPYQQLIAGSVEDEKLAQQIYIELVKAFDYDNDGDWTDYDRTDETLAMNAINKIKNKGVLEKLNAKIAAGGFPEIKNVEQWFKLEMSDWDPAEWDSIANRLNNLGYSVPKAGTIGKIYGYTVGGAINMVDKGVTAAEDIFNYANKQTAGAVAKYTQVQVKDMLKNQVSPSIDFIAQLLLNASRWYEDDEEIIEMAFARIHSMERYKQLKTLIGQDPYKYVKSLISNTGIVYGKSKGTSNTPLSQTIDASYATIMATPKTTNIQPKQAYMKYRGNELPFTSENPTGTNQKFAGEPLFWKIFEGKVKDPYLENGKGVVPDGYLWGHNPSVYPIPEPYPTEDIQALRVFANQGAYRPLNERNKKNKNLTEQVSATKYNQNSKQVDILGNDALAKLRKMEAWNSELANQEKYIPKYCTAPNKIKERMDYKVQPTGSGDYGAMSESINKNSKIIEEHSKKQILEVSGEGDEVQFKKTEGSTDTKLTGKETVISMAAQCRDFGGLWVYGTQTGKPECFCRDRANPLLSGKVGTNQNNKNVYINVASDNSKTQTYTDWSNPDVIENTAKTAISMISGIASLFVPVVGPYIAIAAAGTNFAISASNGQTQEAALYLIFDLLPGVAAVTIGPKMAKELVKSILKSKILNLNQIKMVLTAVNASEAISTKVSQQLSIAAKKGLINQTSANAAKLLTKKVEAQLLGNVGADGITWKKIAKKGAESIPDHSTSESG